ncbi:hypothetical protein [Streptomyces sp. PU_AKi4]
MLHEKHRLIGRPVRDTASGRTGIPQAIAPDVGTDTPVAWLRPSGGGIELDDAGWGDRSGYSAHAGPGIPSRALTAGRWRRASGGSTGGAPARAV